MSKTESVPVIESKPVPVQSAPKEADKFICQSETIEDGKTFHYLYNPQEKDASKAWKKSESCSK